jgi:hypothetical protein
MLDSIEIDGLVLTACSDYSLFDGIEKALLPIKSLKFSPTKRGSIPLTRFP